jgi:hypothetical protein
MRLVEGQGCAPSPVLGDQYSSEWAGGGSIYAPENLRGCGLRGMHLCPFLASSGIEAM